MSNSVRTSDYANSCHWDTIISKPDFANAVDDIGELKAAGFRPRDLATWNGRKFIPISRAGLVDTEAFYGVYNKPYKVYTFSWTPGTITPLNHTTITFDIAGVTEGQPVVVGVPSILEGCKYSAESIIGGVEVDIYNPTPYDITIAKFPLQILVLK